MNDTWLVLAVAVVAVACGGGDDGGGGGSGGGAGSGTGGSAMGGALGSGGANGGGGSASGGGGASAGAGGMSLPMDPKPVGPVAMCFGGCPLGECDNRGTFADDPCSTVYPAPVSADSTYCKAGEDSEYCLAIGTGDNLADYHFHAIYCRAGVASVDDCDTKTCAIFQGDAICLKK